MIGEGALSLREFVMREPLPLAEIQDAVLRFLKGRDDAVVFGAQAVNAYVDEYRMSQDVDILSPRAEQLTEELRSHLAERFHIAVRSRAVGEGRGFRLFQVRTPKNRRLVDVRSVEELPAAQRIGDLLVLMPPELVAGKVVAYCRRRGRPKAGTEWRDLAMLLLKISRAQERSRSDHRPTASTGRSRSTGGLEVDRLSRNRTGRGGRGVPVGPNPHPAFDWKPLHWTMAIWGLRKVLGDDS